MYYFCIGFDGIKPLNYYFIYDNWDVYHANWAFVCYAWSRKTNLSWEAYASTHSKPVEYSETTCRTGGIICFYQPLLLPHFYWLAFFVTFIVCPSSNKHYLPIKTTIKMLTLLVGLFCLAIDRLRNFLTIKKTQIQITQVNKTKIPKTIHLKAESSFN